MNQTCESKTEDLSMSCRGAHTPLFNVVESLNLHHVHQSPPRGRGVAERNFALMFVSHRILYISLGSGSKQRFATVLFTLLCLEAGERESWDASIFVKGLHSTNSFQMRWKALESRSSIHLSFLFISVLSFLSELLCQGGLWKHEWSQ